MKKLLLPFVLLLFYSAVTAQNVGVGTANPTEKLEVTGNIKFTGDHLATATMSRIAPLYIRGTGLNNNANRVLRIGSTEVYNIGSARGLTFTILNKSNHSVVSSANYDTYGDPAASDNLAAALNALNNSQIGVLTSFDAWEGQVTQNLKDAFKRLGLYKALNTSVGGSRRPYAAIFEGASLSSIPSVSAVEAEHSDNLNQPYAEIRGWLLDGSYVASLQVPSGLATPTGSYAVGVNEAGTVQINNLAGADTRILAVDANGNLVTGGSLGAGYIQNQTAVNQLAGFRINGVGNINNGSPGSNANMAAGSLTIGGTNANYGGGSGWNANTSGLMLEAQDNTEISVHDSGERVASLMYYQGGAVNQLSIGRDMGWGGIGRTNFIGNNYAMFGPNSSWGAYLQVGGNGRVTSEAMVAATNGNLHLDAKDGGFATYINYYSANNTYINANAGNVGIGNTAPGQKLHVSGHTQVNGNLYVSTNNTTGEGIFLADDGSIVDNNDGYASMRFSLGVTVNAGNNDNTRKIILRNDGNIQMVNSDAPTINFNDNNGADYYIHNNGDRLYFLYGDGYNGWNTNRPLTLYQGDKVGINAETPTKRLHVNGDVLPSLWLQQQGNHSYGIVAGLETFDNGSATQDGPRIGFHKHGAKTWSTGIEPYGAHGFGVWEDSYDNGWGGLRFVIRPGYDRPTFFKGRNDGDWTQADLVVERSGSLGYYPSIAFHNPGMTAAQWFGSYSPERINAGNCCDDFGWVPVGASGFQNLSDLSMKKNVEDLTTDDFYASLDQIRKIQSIRYNYLNEVTTEPEPYTGQIKRLKPHIGVAAQSLPDMVVEEMTKSPATAKFGYVKGYNLGDMDGLLVAGVKALDHAQQQQNADIQALEQRIEQQQQTIEELLQMVKEQRMLIEKLSVK